MRTLEIDGTCKTDPVCVARMQAVDIVSVFTLLVVFRNGLEESFADVGIKPTKGNFQRSRVSVGRCILFHFKGFSLLIWSVMIVKENKNKLTFSNKGIRSLALHPGLL
jgi:hypothetical protein